MAVRTYTRTLFHDDLREATIILNFFENNKYEDEEPVNTIRVKGLKKWQLVEGGDEAKALEEVCEKDEYNEYLVLYFENGDNEIYPNTKVVMFVV